MPKPPLLPNHKKLLARLAKAPLLQGWLPWSFDRRLAARALVKWGYAQLDYAWFPGRLILSITDKGRAEHELLAARDLTRLA